MKQVAAKLQGSDSADAQFEAARDDDARAAARRWSITSCRDDDVERIMRHPLVAIASDSSVLTLGEGVPHPRGYGNNVRVLGEYVRKRQVITLEEAIRKMTSLPAEHFSFDGAASSKAGYAADIVVSIRRRSATRATFEKPHAYAAGIPYVLVNGVVVIRKGEDTGAKPGVALMRGRS